MKSGGGNMGSHKHGISGNSGPSPRFKMWRQLNDAEESALRNSRKMLTRKMYGSVREAIASKEDAR